MLLDIMVWSSITKDIFSLIPTESSVENESVDTEVGRMGRWAKGFLNFLVAYDFKKYIEM